MVKILDINNLCYGDFNNIKLSFDSKKYYSIIGGNKCGKTTLFKIMTGIICTNNSIMCNNVLLNSKSRNKYIKEIGVVLRVKKDSFLCKSVYDEMCYPLKNLRYSKTYSDDVINKYLKDFDKLDFLDKKIKPPSQIAAGGEEPLFCYLMESAIFSKAIAILNSKIELIVSREIFPL